MSTRSEVGVLRFVVRVAHRARHAGRDWMQNELGSGHGVALFGRGTMYGDLSADEIDALLRRHRYGRVAFTLDEEVYVIPINYAYDGMRLYGQAPAGAKGQLPGGTKVSGMRQDPHVAFQLDEIEDPAHWRSVLLQGRFHELHDPAEKQAAFERIVAQAGGGERSEVSWALSIDELVVFIVEITQRHGRFEQREAYDLRPLPKGPLPPIGRL